DDERSAQHRRPGPCPNGVQPVDPVRVVPPLHGRRGAHRPDHGHEDPLGHQDRRCAAGVRRGGHRAAPRRAGGLDDRERHAPGRRGDLPPHQRRHHPRHAAARPRPAGPGREGRRRAGHHPAPREGRPGELQGVHRVARHRGGRLARGRGRAAAAL
ncbi:MAG: cyclase/dehydrase, partial [uncultured Pseudonocardia sp.]